jgi:hypothetical protein
VHQKRKSSALPMISTDTIGSSCNPKLLIHFEQYLALFISSMVTARFTFTVISVREPSGTGTRMLQPPIFPSNKGKF